MRSVGSGVFAVVLVAGLAACSPAASEDVVTLEVTEGPSAEVSVHGYVNDATAAYAACLEAVGIVVAPLEFEGLKGYAEIEDAVFLPDASGAGTDNPDRHEISVGGVNRDAEIRTCYADNAGAKDSMLDMGDYDAPHEPYVLPANEVEAGRQWAECARDHGVAAVDDPDAEGYVLIPEEVSIEQAEMLGEACSLSMAEDEYWPSFEIEAGVYDADMDGYDSTPFAIALDGPFLNSDRARQFCEENPGECE